MKLTSELTGLDGLHRALSRIADDAELEEQLRTAAQALREAARAGLADNRPPESRSGALARSLIVEIAEDGKSAIVGTALEYGWHLEMGSLERPALPWLEPALHESSAGIVRRLKAWLANSARNPF